jgi:hypothetical protein
MVARCKRRGAVENELEADQVLVPFHLERKLCRTSLTRSRTWDDMTHAIIRGKNGRRHEVDFGDSPVHVEVYASEETVEIVVEADFETLPEERRRFALINVSRQQFSHATGEAARRATRKERYRRATSA